MAGKFQDGVSTTQVPVNNWRAYDEGVRARIASASPGNSPHPANSESDLAWDAGVVDAAAGTIDEQSAYTGQTGPA